MKAKMWMNRWLVIWLMMFVSCGLQSQPMVHLSTDSLCHPGQAQVAVTVDQFNGVAAFTINIAVDPTVLVYDTISHVHPALSGGFLLVTSPPAANPIAISYVDLNALNLGSDTLFYIEYQFLGGSSPVDFSSSPPGNELLNTSAQVIIGSTFSNGQVFQSNPPSILQQPIDSLEVCIGDMIDLFIDAPTATSFLWQYADTAAGSPWQDATTGGYNGGSSAVLGFNAVQTFRYRCIVSDYCSDTSDVSMVIVLPLPLVDAGPDQIITQGQGVTLNGSGGPSWMWSTGALTQAINVSPLITTTYYLTVNNGQCQGIDSVTVTVMPLPTITLEIGSFTACGDTVYVPVMAQGFDSVAAFSLYINAIPSNASIPLPFVQDIHPLIQPPALLQHNNVNGYLIIAFFTPSNKVFVGNDTLFTIRLISQGGSFQFNWDQQFSIISPDGSIGFPLNFINGQVKVLPLPAPPLVVGDSICTGDLATLYGSGGGQVQWYDSPSGGITIQTGQSFNPSTSISGSYTYYTSIIDTNGCVSSRIPLPLLVYPLPQADAGIDTTVNYGDPAFLHGQGNGGQPPYAYLWSPPSLLITANQALTSTLPLTTNQVFNLSVTDSLGCSHDDDILVSVNGGPLSIDSIAANHTTFCEGDSCQLMAFIQGGTGQYIYSWSPALVFNDPGSAMPMAGPSIPQVLTLLVTDLITGDTVSASMPVTVLPAPQYFELSGDTAFCPGQHAPVQLAGSENGVLYTLFRDQVAITTAIPGTGNPLLFGPFADTGRYWVLAENDMSGCFALEQDTITFEFYEAPEALIIAPADTLVCQGDSILLMALMDSAWSYQWIFDTVQLLGTGSQIHASAAGSYYVVTTNPEGCQDTSNYIFLSNSALPNISFPGTYSFCETDSVQLQALVGGGIPTYQYQWQSSGSGWLSSHTVEQPWFKANAGVFTVNLEITDSLGCMGLGSTPVTVHIRPASEAGQDTTIIYGTAATLHGTTSPLGSYTYNWSPGGLLSVPGSAQTSTLPITQTTTFFLDVTDANSGCGSRDSMTVFITGGLLEIAHIIKNPDTVCPGDTMWLEVVATGGSGQYQYLWWSSVANLFSQPDSMSTAIKPNVLTYINIRVTDTISGLFVDSTFFVQVYPRPTVVGIPTSVCEGDSIGLNANISVGTIAPYSYNWTGPTGFNASGLSVFRYPSASNHAGLYSVFLTDGRGCRDTAQFPVIVRDTPTIVIAGNTHICQGDTAFLDASATLATFYAWSNGSNTASTFVNPLSTGIYTLSATRNSCTGTAEVLVTVIPPQVVDYYDTLCQGDSVSFAGITLFSSGIYDDTLIGSNTCDSIIRLQLLVHPLPLELSPLSPLAIFHIPVCEHDSAEIYLTNSQPGIEYHLYDTISAITYGSPLFGNGDSLKFLIPPSAHFGHFRILAIDTITHCERMLDTVIHIQRHTTPIPWISPDTLVCVGDSLLITASGGITYHWNTGDMTASIWVNPSTQSTYTVSVSSGQGCTASTSTLVDTHPIVLANAGQDVMIGFGTDTILYGNAGGSPGPFDYAWQPAGLLVNAMIPQPTTLPLTASATFHLSVTDLLTGCIGIDSMRVYVSGGPLEIIQAWADPPAVCIGDSMQLLVSAIGGTGAYHYRWDSLGGGTYSYQADPYCSPNASMTWQVIVSDSFHSDTALVSVMVWTLPTAQTWGDTSLCVGDTAHLLAAGGVMYQWDTLSPQTSGALDWITTGTANVPVLVTDANGCTDIAYVEVTALPSPHLVMFNTSPICEGDTFFLLSDFTPTGFTSPPYSYSWTGPQGYFNAVYDALLQAGDTNMAGYYSFQLSDGNGCRFEDSTLVIIYPAPVVGMSGLETAYCENDLVDTLQGYSVQTGWFTGPGINDLGNGVAYFNPGAAGPGQHAIRYAAFGNHGCYNDTVAIVTVHPVVPAEIQGLQSSYCSNDIIDTLFGIPPIGIFTGSGIINLTPGKALINPAAAGFGSNININYSYTSAFGCTDDTTMTITVHHSPSANAGPDLSISAGNDTILYGSGTGNRLRYEWQPSSWLVDPLIPIPSTTPLGLTTPFVITVTDTFTGCFATDTMIVTVTGSPLSLINIQAQPAFVCQGDTIQLSVTAGGGSGYYTYAWSPTASLNNPAIRLPLAWPSATTSFSVTVSDQLTGATKDSSINVSVYQKPDVLLVATTVICDQGNIPLTAMINNSTIPPYTYNWSGPAGFIANLHDTVLSGVSFWATGMYSLTITDGRGCTGTDTATITVWPNPISSLQADTNETCINGPPISLTPAVGPGWFIGPGVVGSSFDPGLAGSGLASVGFVLTDTIACMDTAWVDIMVHPLPTSFALTGGGSYCSADSGVHIGLSNSQQNVSYLLINNGLPLITPLMGNGMALDFGLFDLPGTYRVVASDTLTGCYDTLSGQINVSIIQSPIADAGSDTNLCAGGSVQLQASGGGSYQWTPSTSLSNPLIYNPIATPTTSTWYHLTATANGCPDYDSVLVTVYALPTISLNPDTTICLGDSIQLQAGGGSAYQWSPSAGLSSVSISNPWANPLSTTTYVVSVSQNGCTTTEDIEIQVTTLSGISTSPDTSICLGDQVTLSASGGSTYIWSTTPPSTYASINVTPSATTTYYVTISQGLCSAIDSVIITILPLPLIGISLDTSICLGDSIPLFASGGNTYHWTPIAGLSSGNIPNPMASPIDTTKYYVTVTNGFCSAMDSVTISVIPLPNALAGSDTSICEGDTAWLTSSGGTTYLWTPGLGLSDPNISNPYAMPGISTTYTVRVGNGQCYDYDTVMVNVVQAPVISMSPASPSLCAGDTIGLQASGALYFSWDPPTGLSSTSGSYVQAFPSISTTYTIRAEDAYGCADSMQVNVMVNPLPVLSLQMPDSTLCQGDVIPILAGGASQYFWSPPQGLSNTMGASITAFPAWTTDYTLLGVSNEGCTSQRKFRLIVIPRPKIDLGPDRYICIGDILKLTAGEDSTYFEAIWQDGSLGSYYYATTPGLYWVSLDNGICPASDTILLSPCTDLWVPNAFTPNADGVNDLFTPQASTELLKYHLLIYNRWGELVFESFDIQNTWDGTFKGQLCPLGVYNWVIDYTGMADRLIYKANRKKGSVVLVR